MRSIVNCHRLDKLEQMNERALVLGGGGVAGIAWTTGLLFGLSEQGVDLRDAELIVGTQETKSLLKGSLKGSKCS